MAKVSLTSCCGLIELHEISFHKTAYEVLRDVGPKMLSFGMVEVKDRQVLNFGRLRPFVLFTGVTGYHKNPPNTYQYGDNFANFIRANNLGELIETPEGRNWTNNMVKVWVWKPDYPNLMQWLVYEGAWGDPQKVAPKVVPINRAAQTVYNTYDTITPF